MTANPAQDVLSPSLTELLQLVKDGAAAKINAVSWGQVESYDADLQEATVQVVPRRVWIDNTNTRQTERKAQLLDVPVILPGSGASGMTFPINTGDFVLLLFLDQAADGWFRTGGNDADPGDPRRHSLSDAVAIAGLSPRTSRLSTPPDNVVVQDPSKVQLGSSSAAEAVVLGDTYRTAEDSYFGALEAMMTVIVAFPVLAAYFAIPDSPQQTALAAWLAAVTAFHTASASYLSLKVKSE